MNQFIKILFLLVFLVLPACGSLQGTGLGFGLGSVTGGGLVDDDSVIPEQSVTISLDEINLDHDVIEIPLDQFATRDSEDQVDVIDPNDFSQDIIPLDEMTVPLDEAETDGIYSDAQNFLDQNANQQDLLEDDYNEEDVLAQIDQDQADFLSDETNANDETPYFSPEPNRMIQDDSGLDQDTNLDGSSPVDIVVSPPFNDEDPLADEEACDAQGEIVAVLMPTQMRQDDEPQLMTVSMNLTDEQREMILNDDQGSSVEFKRCELIDDDGKLVLIWQPLADEILKNRYKVSVKLNINDQLVEMVQDREKQRLFIPSAMQKVATNAVLNIQALQSVKTTVEKETTTEAATQNTPIKSVSQTVQKSVLSTIPSWFF